MPQLGLMVTFCKQAKRFRDARPLRGSNDGQGKFFMPGVVTRWS
jgi:hypothetical protein